MLPLLDQPLFIYSIKIGEKCQRAWTFETNSTKTPGNLKEFWMKAYIFGILGAGARVCVCLWVITQQLFNAISIVGMK